MRFSLKSSALAAFITLFLPEFCPAQQGVVKSQSANARDAYEKAGVFTSANQYDAAIAELTAAIRFDPKFVAAYQKRGDLYRVQKKYQLARPDYEKVVSLDTGFYQGTWFGLGESEAGSGAYTEALVHLKRYLGYPNKPAATRAKAAKIIADCTFSIEALKSPVPFKPYNIGPGINTAALEYLPVVTADEQTLIFTRQEGQREDFFVSLKSGGQWQKAVPLPGQVNTSQYNEGAQCLSPDGRYLFFTGCNRPGGAGSCDIYITSKEGNSWGEPFRLGAPLNTRYWESQPSISADGKTLYFVSNRPGGHGGTDLYRADLQAGGEWSEPRNLGPTINTPYDEQSPFIHPDNQTLYFSSSGWPGLGDKDLFLSRKDSTGAWQKPVNLGYPINTSGEEAGITISSSGKTAYFNAIRPEGSGKQDIYTFELPVNIQPLPVTYVKGHVTDKKTGKALEATLRVTDLAEHKVIYEDESDGTEGGFMTTLPAGKSYALHINKPGYLFHSENFTLTDPSTPLKPFEVTVALEPIETGSISVMRNIFFDTNKFELLPDSEDELLKLVAFLEENKTVTIEIGGHTDDVGDENANQILSEKRAKSVFDFLVAKQVSPARMRFKGYGESKPVSDNSTVEGKRANRRTEIRITAR